MSASSIPYCAGDCGEWDFSPNTEAYEVLGELYCDDCAEAYLDAVLVDDDPLLPAPAPASDAGLGRLPLTPTTIACGDGPPPPEGAELAVRWPVLGPGAL